MATQKLQKKVEDAGCPYFFDKVCKVEVDDTIFNSYCLDKFKHCNFYNIIKKQERLNWKNKQKKIIINGLQQ